jgi:hypothetical protein
MVLVVVIAFVIFIATSIVCLIAILRKKADRNNLVVIGLLPIMVVALYKAPFPNYVDGMYKTMKATLSLNEIRAFSHDVHESNPDWTKRREHNQIIEKLRTKYPNSLNLSRLPPRVEVTDKYLSVFYGSSLAKHWGYLVTNLDYFPIENIPDGMYKKVYDGVWVYHDIR